ncbi:MAG: PorV/PorQ family protein [Candidatus Poribacteria bacterium]|nr:PorV/PorQ family protein [Candidatus Poribacteria bacterium]
MLRKDLVVFLFACALGLMAVSTALAAEGSHAAEFLSHGVGARALGMGSVFVSIADDATAAYWNPAGLAQIQRHAFSTMYSDSFGSGEGGFLGKGLVEYNFVNYVQRIEGIGSVGISWIRLGVDKIPHTTFVDTNKNGIDDDFDDRNGNGIKEEGELYFEPPQVIGEFSNTDNAVLISYARQVHPHIAVGGNLKLLRQSIFENSGNGFGLDLGLMLEPYRGLRVGAMLEDATGTQIRWNTPDEPTFTRDPRLRIGVSYHIDLPGIGHATFGADLETDRKDFEVGEDSSGGTLFRFGAEYWLFNVVALRIGAEGDELATGAGLRLRFGETTLFADYAFNAHDLGDSQRISISGLF